MRSLSLQNLRRRIGGGRRAKKSPACTERPKSAQCEDAGSCTTDAGSTAGSTVNASSRPTSGSVIQGSSTARSTGRLRLKNEQMLTKRLHQVSERLELLETEILSERNNKAQLEAGRSRPGSRSCSRPGSSLGQSRAQTAPSLHSQCGALNTSPSLSSPSRRRRPVLCPEQQWADSVLGDLPSIRRTFEEERGLRNSQSAPSLENQRATSSSSTVRGIVFSDRPSTSGGLVYSSELSLYFPDMHQDTRHGSKLDKIPHAAADLPPLRHVRQTGAQRRPGSSDNRPISKASNSSQKAKSAEKAGQMKWRNSIESVDISSCEPSPKHIPPPCPTSLAEIAFRMKIPFETVRDASAIFRSHARTGLISDDILRDGRLMPDDLKRAICTMTQVSSIEELPPQTVESALRTADTNGDGELDFEEFVMWYYQRSFSDYINLTKEAFECREIANELGIAVSDAEDCKRLFDRIDADHNGSLDFDEFKAFVNGLASRTFDSRKKLELSEARVTHFWQLCDTQNHGEVTFPEFACFYSLHFPKDSFDLGETFYSGVRQRCMGQRSSVHDKDAKAA